jgi:tetratricopeptide (TPR) repeat protein
MSPWTTRPWYVIQTPNECARFALSSALIPISLRSQGRWSHHQTQKYDMSPCVENWSGVQKLLTRLDSVGIMDSIDCVLPDEIPPSRDISRGNFGFLSIRNSTRRTRLGNDLHKLPRLLAKNYFATVRGILEGMVPVESGARHLKYRISLIRLRYQADRLGLNWNPSLPWQFECPDASVTDTKCIHSADLVPDYPSDWILHDPEMTQTPWNFEDYFNLKDYQGFYMERYSCLEMDEPCPAAFVFSTQCTGSRDEFAERAETCGEERPANDRDPDSIHNLLLKTIKLLKDGGNQSLQEGALDLAASRYDKALCYGSIASMTFPSKGQLFAHAKACLGIDNGSFPFLTWNEHAQLLIRIRLNLALLFLMPHFSKPQEAIRQALNALHDLDPFCAQKGKIMKGENLDKVHGESEREETYLEAKALQAKAYFRLGSAQYELGDFSDAILSYGSSVSASEQAKAKPDKLVLRRLSEAKRESRLARKRERTKFEFGFAGVVSPDNNKSGRPNDINGS